MIQLAEDLVVPHRGYGRRQRQCAPYGIVGLSKERSLDPEAHSQMLVRGNARTYIQLHRFCYSRQGLCQS